MPRQRIAMDVPQARRRFAVRLALLVGTALFGVLHVIQIDAPASLGVPWDVRLQEHWVARALDDPGHTWSQQFFPEGELFEAEFYGLALANIAQTTRAPDDVATAVNTLRKILPSLEPMVNHAPLRSMAHWELRGGIMWFGGQNLLRGRLLQLATDPRPEELERFHRDSATLARLFANSQAGLLESFPGKPWPVDNLFAYRSLQIHDALYGTAYAAGFAKLRAALVRSQDRATGLAPSFLALDGRAKDLPRGCGLSWSLAVLRELDPAYAAGQWKAYRAQFFRCRFGLCLVREYPPGRDREMDLDSGPMVGGLGMAASGFGLAAARAEGDVEASDALTRTGELFGFPSISWWGKRYLGGEVTFLDVMALWSKTVPFPEGTLDVRPTHFPLAVLLIAAFWVLMVLLQRPGVVRARDALHAASGSSRFQLAIEVVTYGLLLLHLAIPGFRAGLLLVAWFALGWISTVAARLAGSDVRP